MWLAVAILLGIVFCRAQATYWLGRGVITGALQTRFAQKLSGPKITRATELINRWGAPVVTLSFLTIGFQTVVNAAAGFMRMSWIRYTLAMLPGCIAWAFLYATIGFAAFEAGVALATGSVWAWAVLAVLLIGALTWRLLRRRARRTAPVAVVEEPQNAADRP